MKRLPELDTLRGLSLFGVLVVNVPFFLTADAGLSTSLRSEATPWWDLAAAFVMHAFFEGKFILIFSFLFGVGFFAQMQRSQDFRPAYYRRLLGLLVIGLLHAALLFVGDILVTYALLGLPLLWVRHWPAKKLLKAAGACWAVSVVVHVVLAGLLFSSDSTVLSDVEATTAIMREGSYAQIVEHRLGELAFVYAITPFFFVPTVFAMFMVGLAAAKTALHQGFDTPVNQASSGFVLRWCLLPAVVLNVAYAWLSLSSPLHQAIGFALRGLAVPLLTMVYLALAVRCLSHPLALRLGTWAGGEGRMSLTIYVGESVLMGFLALSYGFSLFGRVGAAGQLALAAGVYLVLVIGSLLWLRVFKLGPLEWLLRSVTHGRLIAMR
jgi:uncharacterized protein